MSEEKEVIGLLPDEGSKDRAEPTRALVRLADGRMRVEKLDEAVRSLVRFRRGQPIVDPHTREVIGYEMEQVSLAVGA